MMRARESRAIALTSPCGFGTVARLEAITNYARDEALAFVQRAQVAVASWTETRLSASLDSLWRWLESIPDLHGAADRIVVSSAVLRVAARVLPGCSGEHLLGDDEPPRSHARDGSQSAAAALWYIRTNYRDPQICLERIADYVGVSRYHLSRLIVASTGHGVPTHVNGLRLLAAGVLLRATALRTKEVADLIGYRRTSQLDRQFREWFRMTPSEFRHGVAVTADAGPEVYAALSSGLARQRYRTPCEAADSLGVDLGTVLAAAAQPQRRYGAAVSEVLLGPGAAPPRAPEPEYATSVAGDSGDGVTVPSP